jgi:hypothetical protein
MKGCSGPEKTGRKRRRALGGVFSADRAGGAHVRFAEPGHAARISGKKRGLPASLGAGLLYNADQSISSPRMGHVGEVW